MVESGTHAVLVALGLDEEARARGIRDVGGGGGNEGRHGEESSQEWDEHTGRAIAIGGLDGSLSGRRGFDTGRAQGPIRALLEVLPPPAASALQGERQRITCIAFPLLHDDGSDRPALARLPL